MTVAFFAISGLDMLDKMDVIEKQCNPMIDWIYSMQYLPNAPRKELIISDMYTSIKPNPNH